jgi:hypothetical protein
LSTAWALFQGLLIEALPFLLIGVLISSVARWLAPGGRWLRRLPGHPLLGPLSGAALGFALPACECGNVPVARRLLVAGAPLGTALGFLFAAPVLNPIVIASTWAAFPDQPWLWLARPLGAVLVSLALCLLLRMIPDEQLLQADVLAERRLNQPLSAVTLLQRRSGIVGLSTATAADPARQPRSEQLLPPVRARPAAAPLARLSPLHRARGTGAGPASALSRHPGAGGQQLPGGRRTPVAGSDRWPSTT